MANFSESVESYDLSAANLNESPGTSGLFNRGFTILVWICAASGLVFLVWMAWIVFQDARPAIDKFGLGFLWGTTWDVNVLTFGGLPFIYGSVISSILALLLAIPLSVAVALTTSENFLPASIRYPIGFLVELIASIPSVIIGLWGIFVMIPVLKPLQEWLFQNFAWFPLFSTQPLGPSMFIAGVILAIMIVPTISAISRDVLLTVPAELRSASMALGATRWETIWRVLLPAASSGIIGAIILGLGRALGETMAVAMVIGNSSIISPSLLAPGYTIPAVLANTFPEAFEKLHIGALMYLALILFVITLVVNSVAALLVQFINRNR
jgi:phosphate transport system permease protein